MANNALGLARGEATLAPNSAVKQSATPGNCPQLLHITLLFVKRLRHGWAPWLYQPLHDDKLSKATDAPKPRDTKKQQLRHKKRVKANASNSRKQDTYNFRQLVCSALVDLCKLDNLKILISVGVVIYIHQIPGENRF